LSLCYECMRVCPITQSSMMVKPIAKEGGLRQKVSEAKNQAQTDIETGVDP